MFQIAIQVRELISSNVSSLVDCATDPARMLKQLRREIEESIISLRGGQAQAKRRAEHLSGELTKLELLEADWEDKAGSAMSHSREDLARAALLERDKASQQLTTRRAELTTTEAELAEVTAALAALEAKLDEVRAKVVEAEAARIERTANARAQFTPAPSATARKLDRIATMEQRVAFAQADRVDPTSASVKSEIEGLIREQELKAELDELRRKFAPSGKRKG